MSERKPIFLMRGPRLAIALMVSAVAMILMAWGVAAPNTPAATKTPNTRRDTGCYANKICTWDYSQYSGVKNVIDCSFGIYSFSEDNSAKNRCGNRRARFGWSDGDFINWKFCMNPGGDRPDPGRFNRLDVGAIGSQC
jgi:hypothetical protein